MAEALDRTKRERSEATWLQHVLVCLDGSDQSERTIPYAVSLARIWGSRITLFRVLESDPNHHPADAFEWRIAGAESRQYLAALKERAEDYGLAVDVELVQGQAAEQILVEQRERGVDLTILASDGGAGSSRGELGSTAQRVTAHGQGSLLIVPRGAGVESPPRFRRVLVPLDGSCRAESVLPVAERIVRDHDGELILVHVVPTPQIAFSSHFPHEGRELAVQLERYGEQAAESHLAQLKDRISVDGLRVRFLIRRREDVRETVVELAEQEGADLILLAAHGQTGSCRTPYGSITRHLIGKGTVPLLIIQDVRRGEREWPTVSERAVKSPLRVGSQSSGRD